MEDYKIWNKSKQYGNLLYDRAIGKKEEMESSKSVCEVIKPIYKKGMKILDVGCGAGHYLRSLREHLDKNVNYTGIDATEYYIDKASKAFPGVRFFIDDINDIDFKDNSFDIVICNNVLVHLPPSLDNPINELLRVSSKYVIIRTPIAKRNYIIKEVRDHKDKLNKEVIKKLTVLINKKGEPTMWNYLNLYTKEFLEDIVLKVNPDYVVNFIKDNGFKKLKDKAESETVTKIIEGKQVSGNIILDWYFVVVGVS